METDYSRFLYPPFSLETVKKLEKYNEFGFMVPDKQKAVDYIILMYDIASIEVKTHSDNLYERKKYAAVKAGLTLGSNGKFSTWVENILVGENDQFNDAVIRFIRLFGMPDLPILIAFSQLLDNELVSAFKERDHAEIGKLRKNINELKDEVEALELKIFSGKETENVRSSLYRMIEKEKLNLRPEDKAREIAELRVSLPDPHRLI